MSVTLRITEISTGRCIASTWALSEFDAWRTVEPVVAEWFGVPVDDVGLGDDCVMIGAEPVGTMHVKYS